MKKIDFIKYRLTVLKLYHNMKKGVIIYGPRCSGKSTRAEEFASHFKKEEVLKMGWPIYKKINEALKGKKIKCLVIDDVIDVAHVDEIAKQFDYTIIFVLQSKMKKKHLSFYAKQNFDMLKCTSMMDVKRII